jgi:hypothetical protein
MIKLLYGDRQQFRWRHDDINILGYTDAKLPIKNSQYTLNDSSPLHFYVEPEPEPGEPKYPWQTRTPSVLRLKDRPGHFNIEIAITHPQLKEGWNQIKIAIADARGQIDKLEAQFHWNSNPLPLPLDLKALSQYNHIQEIGQVVDGDFDFDPEKNTIFTRSPVASDVLLLLGSPYGSQEATYEVQFADNGRDWCFMGLSDFFAGHLPQSPELGIKPGYSTAGLVTLDGQGLPGIWLAWGDSLYDRETSWAIKTEKEFKLPIQANVTYCVRHQVIIDRGTNYARFRMWKKGNPEPNVWVCQEHNFHLEPKLPRITQASFGLFQSWGQPTQWSNISVKVLNLNLEKAIGSR